MIFLTIETAHERGFVMLSQGSNPIAFSELPPGQKQSPLLFPLIEELLDEHSLSLEEMSAIATGLGPGSFTGIRIAASAAVGIAKGASLPLIGLSSLELWGSDAPFATLIDARVGGAYLWKPGHRAKLVPHSHLLSELEGCKVLFSPMAKRLDFLPIPIEEGPPHKAVVAKKVFDSFEEKKFVEGGCPKPLYLRSPVEE